MCRNSIFKKNKLHKISFWSNCITVLLSLSFISSRLCSFTEHMHDWGTCRAVLNGVTWIPVCMIVSSWCLFWQTLVQNMLILKYYSPIWPIVCFSRELSSSDLKCGKSKYSFVQRIHTISVYHSNNAKIALSAKININLRQHCQTEGKVKALTHRLQVSWPSLPTGEVYTGKLVPTRLWYL